VSPHSSAEGRHNTVATCFTSGDKKVDRSITTPTHFRHGNTYMFNTNEGHHVPSTILVQGKAHGRMLDAKIKGV
jgi:hypothetical protein